MGTDVRSRGDLTYNYNYRPTNIKNNQFKAIIINTEYRIILFPRFVRLIFTDLLVTAPAKNNSEKIISPTAKIGTSGLNINDETRSN